MMRTVRAAPFVVMATCLAFGCRAPCHALCQLLRLPARMSRRSSSPGTSFAPRPKSSPSSACGPDQPYIEENIRSGTDKLYAKGWFTPNGIELRTIERPDGKINVILYVTELTNFIEEIKYVGTPAPEQNRNWINLPGCASACQCRRT